MKLRCILLSLLLMAVACQVQQPREAVAPLPVPETAEPGVVPGLLTVQFDEQMLSLIEEDLASGCVQTKSAALNGLLEDYGIVHIERVFPDAGEYEARTREAGLHRFYQLEFADSLPVTKAAGRFRELPGVLSASPQRKVYPRAQFNDPLFSRQWHLVNSQHTGADINVQPVWDNYTTGSADVIVCVVDECIDATHPDLQGNLWTDRHGHTGYNFARDNNDLTIRPEDGEGDTGHGTHVAGIIAAVNNNGTGVAGIAGGNAAAGIPGVRIMSAAIFSGRESASETESARAIKWGADAGAVISQNSWGYSADGCLDDTPDGRISDEELRFYKSWVIDEDLRAAIDYFIRYAGCDAQGKRRPDAPMKGGLVFFAAGNESIDYDPVCTYEPVITVGAFSETGQKASYSNYGNWVDIAAPGGEGGYSYDSIWSTLPVRIVTSGYGGTEWAGTSMACPQVTGVAALLVSYFGGPETEFTAEDCRDYLFGGLGEALGGSRPIGRKLNAAASFRYGLNHQSGAPVIAFSQNPVNLKAHEEVSVQVSVIPSEGVKLSCSTTAPGFHFDPSSGIITLVGKEAPEGTFSVEIVATAAGGESGMAAFSYTILPNHAPRVVSTPVNILLKGKVPETSLNLAPYFKDDDGEPLRYEAKAEEEEVVSLTVSEDKLYLSAAVFGTTQVTVTALDIREAKAEVSFLVAHPNPEKPLVVWPQPAEDELFISIDTQELTPVEVTLYSGTGSRVFHETLSCSAFVPIRVDMEKMAPGRYTAVATYSGEEHSVPVVRR